MFKDAHLESFRGDVQRRVDKYNGFKKTICEAEGSLEKFADGYKFFGWSRLDDPAKDGGWVFREWLPNAHEVFLMGDFNNWNRRSHALTREEFGRWSILLKDNDDGTWAISHRSKYRMVVRSGNGAEVDRVPAYATLVWQNSTTYMFDAVFWQPSAEEKYVARFEKPIRPAGLKVYECHVGMSGISPKVHTYREFKDCVLPRVARLGYNAIQIMAIQEHAHYGSFGYHVTSFFAPSSRQGTPEELKELIDAAHGQGILVLCDIVHSHMSSNVMDGIAALDGSDHCYSHSGPRGHHKLWDSTLFDYSKWEVVKWVFFILIFSISLKVLDVQREVLDV